YAKRMARKAYPSDISSEEWAFVAPYLTLMRDDAPQRDYELREVFNGLRWLVRTGAAWRLMAHDLPPWYTVYQQTRRWLKAGVFEAIVHDPRHLLREIEERARPAGHSFRQSDAASEPRKRCPGGLRRAQAAQRQQGPPGG